MNSLSQASVLLPSKKSSRVRLGLGWLAVPAGLFFVVFFVVPVLSLFAISFTEPAPGVVTAQGEFSLANYERFFTRSNYYMAAVRSVGIAALVSTVCVFLGYPLAYLIAKTEHPGRNTFLMIIVLAAMQLDMVIRLYGLMVLMGDNGLINSILMNLGIVNEPIPLMYNTFGVVTGLVQFTLPFMTLSIIGVVRSIDPSLEEASRSLGASRLSTFLKVTLPLSMPGIMAGTLLVFALSISSYVVPALMGGWKVVVLPIHIYQQIAELGGWQFGAAVGSVLFSLSLLAVIVYYRAAARSVGGRA